MRLELELSQAEDQEVRDTQDAVRRALRDAGEALDHPYGSPDREVCESNCTAYPQEPRLVDPTNGALDVTLAEFDSRDVGKVFTVINDSSSTNTITITGADVTISGAATATITAARDVWQGMIVSASNVVTL